MTPAWWLAAALAVPPPTTEDPEIEELVVEAEATGAGERVLHAERIATTPVRSPVELLRAMPGLHLSAHGGRGKAWQLTYRGFDAGHGADLALSVSGVPLNEPSHVHAHGLIDGELVPTMLLERVTLRAAVDRADVGAFGVAAAADLGLGLPIAGLSARLTGGTDGSGALTVAWRPESSPQGTFVRAEADVGAGVTEARSWRMARAAAGVEGRVGTGTGRLWLLAYDGRFRSPGALREDDVAEGRVAFYDGYPGAGGGRSSRLLASGSLTWTSARTRTHVLAWAGLRASRLTQNFTGFSQDEARGDTTRQVHDAHTVGLRAAAHRIWSLAGSPQRLTGGVGLTWDGATQTDDRVDGAGVAWARIADGRLQQVGLEGWAEGDLGWRHLLRVLPGVRVQGWWQAASPREADVPDTRWLATAAPRVRLEARPHTAVRLQAGYGRGFRPPLASGGVLGALVHADTVHGGLTAWPVRPVGLTATGFWTALGDEVVFDHLAGRFIGSGASRRVGAELLVEANPTPWCASRPRSPGPTAASSPPTRRCPTRPGGWVRCPPACRRPPSASGGSPRACRPGSSAPARCPSASPPAPDGRRLPWPPCPTGIGRSACRWTTSSATAGATVSTSTRAGGTATRRDLTSRRCT